MYTLPFFFQSAVHGDGTGLGFPVCLHAYTRLPQLYCLSAALQALACCSSSEFTLKLSAGFSQTAAKPAASNLRKHLGIAAGFTGSSCFCAAQVVPPERTAADKNKMRMSMAMNPFFCNCETQGLIIDNLKRKPIE